MMKKCKVDRLGRIVIPIQYRREMGLNENSEINIEYAEKKIIITPSRTYCCVCGIMIDEEQKFPLCNKCIKLIKETK